MEQNVLRKELCSGSLGGYQVCLCGFGKWLMAPQVSNEGPFAETGFGPHRGSGLALLRTDFSCTLNVFY